MSLGGPDIFERTFIGLDVHAQSIAACALNPFTGKEFRQPKVGHLGAKKQAMSARFQAISAITRARAEFFALFTEIASWRWPPGRAPRRRQGET
ncbi:hypothetical protein [Paeniglutamicibacter psychrophenolicus]|uniref:hypothetical protein n=1 Tax=Paeniglutamicibacter psychrophenolicus TaxID=257454 RepID=UPI0027896B29|nr:hypothetical protein [Paeniglutamicibacter psychrophenolicus]MDQ0095958.1 hypothetical protein [Paeniglutamicibacter psychrophenolicus]